jgi:hypothetical protein
MPISLTRKGIWKGRKVRRKRERRKGAAQSSALFFYSFCPVLFYYKCRL